MRIDKYLKVSRLIKRRSVAATACDAGRVKVNGKVVKASTKVLVGDIVEIEFGTRIVTIEITNLLDSTKKDDADAMYKYK